MSERIIGYRIEQALKLNQMRQASLCDKCGISPSAMSQYISGAFTPKQDKLSKMADVLKVNEAWLAGYNVEMINEESSPPILSMDEITLIETFRKLNNLGKQEALKRTDELSHLDKYASV